MKNKAEFGRISDEMVYISSIIKKESDNKKDAKHDGFLVYCVSNLPQFNFKELIKGPFKRNASILSGYGLSFEDKSVDFYLMDYSSQKEPYPLKEKDIYEKLEQALDVFYEIKDAKSNEFKVTENGYELHELLSHLVYIFL